MSQGQEATRLGVERLVDDILRGDRRAAARAITLLEDEAPAASALSNRLFRHTGKAYRVGVTGPPGSGKSTLVDRLAVQASRAGMTVGILAVDPSSPFTHGALLGDRARMASATSRPGVFMRSMASRGALGGLARRTLEAVEVLDALGQEIIFLETVGVGQSELEIVNTADVAVVVLTPESGSGLQALKAGVMEIADVLVVNKADRPGAEAMEQQLLEFLDLVDHGRLMGGRVKVGAGVEPWSVPVIKTCATEDRGTSELLEAALGYRRWLEGSGAWAERRHRHARARLREIICGRVEWALWEDAGPRALFEDLVETVATGQTEPEQAAGQFLSRLRAEGLKV